MSFPATPPSDTARRHRSTEPHRRPSMISVEPNTPSLSPPNEPSSPSSPVTPGIGSSNSNGGLFRNMLNRRTSSNNRTHPEPGTPITPQNGKGSGVDGEVGIAGRYGRFKISSAELTKNGEPFVDCPHSVMDDTPVPTKYETGNRKLVTEFLNHWATEVIMFFFTIIALFLTDVSKLFGGPNRDFNDRVVEWVNLIIMLIFFVELYLKSYAERGYFVRNTYFWLDFLAAGSMIFDTPLLAMLFPSGLVAARAGRAGRAARAGSKAGRMVKLIRVTRLMRLTKLVRIGKIFAALADDRNDDGADSVSVSGSDRDRQSKKFDSIDAGADMPAEDRKVAEMSFYRRFSSSHLRMKLEKAKVAQGKNTLASNMMEITIGKVIIGILIMLILSAFLEPEDSSADSSYHGLKQLQLLYDEESETPLVSGSVISKASNNFLKSFPDCYFLRVYNFTFVNEHESFVALRDLESEVAMLPETLTESPTEPNSVDGAHLEAWFDIQESFYLDAYYSFLQTLSLVFLLVGWMIAFHSNASRFAKSIAEPLQMLSNDMNNVSRLVFEETSIVTSKMAEILYIQKSFVTMKNAIQSFAKYVPREIVLNMTMHKKMAKLGVVPRRVSIFFSDIKGFTTICEAMEPNEVLFMLSEYFTAMSKIILETKGVLLEFIGDAILAIWNAPEDVPNHACACIEAALQMQEKLVQLRSHWRDKGYPEIHIRCGIHTDEVFVGNLGAPSRMKYGVMGDGVNLASRLEELNKQYNTNTLISDKTYGCTGIKDLFLLRMRDRVVVKGRKKGTDLYEVVGILNEMGIAQKESTEKYNQCMKLYFEMKFEEAIEGFMNLQKDYEFMTEDKGLLMLMKRCEGFITKPPPEPWNGCHVMLTK